MEALAAAVLTAISNSGPVGAVVAAVLVGLALALIIFARSKGLWNDTKGQSQGIEFQDRLLKLVDTLTASETALRQQIDDMSKKNGALRDDMDEMRATLALVRNQRRRLIELLRSLKEGQAGKGTA